MSEAHFDADRGRLRRVASRPRRRALPRKRAEFIARALPRAGRGSTSAAAPASLAGALADAATRWPASTRPQGMLEVMRARAPRRSAVRRSATDAAVRGRELRPRLQRRGAAPHRRARRRAADADRDGAGRAAGRADRGLGPQPAQPVLAAADGARAPGHRRGAADPARTSCSAAWRRPAPSRVLVDQLGLVPDFAPRRLLGAPQPSSGPSSARPVCGALRPQRRARDEVRQPSALDLVGVNGGGNDAGIVLRLDGRM